MISVICRLRSRKDTIHFFFSSRRRHTRYWRDWSSDVCSSDLCANLNGHGHNYTVEVTVKGEPDAKSGFVIDLKDLKAIMNREVLDVMDHRMLNKEVPEFATQIPTTENLAISIWKRLEGKLKIARLHRVRVYETPDLFVDFYGEK